MPALIPFCGNMVIIYALEDKLVVFQNTKSAVTFDQYFT